MFKVILTIACLSFFMGCGSKAKETPKVDAIVVDTTKKIDTLIKIDSAKAAVKATTAVKTGPVKPKVKIEVKTPVGNAKIEK